MIERKRRIDWHTHSETAREKLVTDLVSNGVEEEVLVWRASVCVCVRLHVSMHLYYMYVCISLLCQASVHACMIMLEYLF